jgi:phosphate transport system protein
MSIHFLRRIDKIKGMIITLGAMVEEAVANAVRAVRERDTELAEHVREYDKQIDLKEIEVEEECLGTLALHQPVAHDLRFLISVLKMNHDLERIGDLAVSIAEHSMVLAEMAPLSLAEFSLDEMSEKAQVMLKQSLDAVVELDVELARKVRKSDDEVDDLLRQACENAEVTVQQSGEHVVQKLRLVAVARDLERMADHAVNISKDVVYLVEGEIVRHRKARKELAERMSK